MDELAGEFGLTTASVLQKISELESPSIVPSLRLSGVVDDRGKYIYVTPAEMEAVAAYVESKGRVSISELAGRCNQLIVLEKPHQATVV